MSQSINIIPHDTPCGLSNFSKTQDLTIILSAFNHLKLDHPIDGIFSNLHSLRPNYTSITLLDLTIVNLFKHNELHPIAPTLFCLKMRCFRILKEQLGINSIIVVKSLSLRILGNLRDEFLRFLGLKNEILLDLLNPQFSFDLEIDRVNHIIIKEFIIFISNFNAISHCLLEFEPFV
jgi:hypothetical protein